MAAAAASTDASSGIDMSQVKGPDSLLRPGANDGQTIMVNEKTTLCRSVSVRNSNGQA